MFLQVLGGMRGMIGMLWETSLLDPEEVSCMHPRHDAMLA